MKLSVTLCQETKCYACAAENARRFYIGNVPYDLCPGCITAITKYGDTVKLMMAYADFNIDYTKL